MDGLEVDFIAHLRIDLGAGRRESCVVHGDFRTVLVDGNHFLALIDRVDDEVELTVGGEDAAVRGGAVVALERHGRDGNLIEGILTLL